MRISEFTKQLPDAFKKTAESNNNKLLLLPDYGFSTVRFALADVDESRDLDKATGKALDLIGQMFQQKRGQMDDEQYRLLIKAKLAKLVIGGDYESTINALNLMFNAKNGEIVLSEAEAPCTVELVKMPIGVLVGAGFTSKQAVEVIETLLPACVKVIAESFEGTFCFSAADDEYNELEGFANDTQTIGGYFGMMLGDDEAAPLPI